MRHSFWEDAMSRLPELRYEQMTAEQQRIHDEIAAGPRGQVVGPLQPWLHAPGLADHAQKLGAYLRFHSALAPALAELAILVTARHWQSEFEWHAHARLARAAGIPEAVIEAIRTDAEPALADPRSRAVHALARELFATRTLSDATYAAAEAALGQRALVDLVGLLGYYALVSMTLNAFAVPTPDGSHPFAD
jgi:4-carboxymuconolactone decarboxylase